MSEKGKGVLAYIFTWIGGLIVLYGMKDNERNTKIHAAQAIVIGIGYMVIYMIYRFIPVYIPFFSTIVYGLYIALVIIGIVKVNKYFIPFLIVIVLLLGVKNVASFSNFEFNTSFAKFPWFVGSLLYASYNLIIVIPILPIMYRVRDCNSALWEH